MIIDDIYIYINIRSTQCHLPGQMVDPPTVPWKQTGDNFCRVLPVASCCFNCLLRDADNTELR